MSTGKKVCLIVAPLAVAVVIGGWLLMRVNPFFEEPAFIVNVSSPMTLAEARKHLRFPLPDGASNILYAEYQEFIAYECMLKFQAPEDICKAYAMDVLRREGGKTEDDAASTELRRITTPRHPIPPRPPLNVDWFDVHNIKRGHVAGGGGSQKPTVWIDSERNVFYYMCTD